MVQLGTYLASALTPVLMDSWQRANTSGASKYDLDSVLGNATGSLFSWVQYLLLILGIIAIGVASYKLYSALASHGKKQDVNYVLIILLYVLGGAFIFGGWTLVAQKFGGGLEKTVDSWASCVLPMLSMFGLL